MGRVVEAAGRAERGLAGGCGWGRGVEVVAGNVTGVVYVSHEVGQGPPTCAAPAEKIPQAQANTS